MGNPGLVKQLEDSEFDYLRGLVYRETGIKLSDLKRSLLQSRLLRRLRALHLPAYSDYIAYIRDHYDAEIIDFINAVTTNKTEFFRENQHFDFLRDVALPELTNRNQKSIRIWSAGCSTGEEAYSIAMTVYDYFLGEIPDVKILATDIDTQVLEKAIAGIYSAESVSDFGMDMLMRHFAKGKGENDGLFKVKDRLRKMVVFKRLNLMDETYPMKKKFDVIFCRNVVIYFDKATQKFLFNKISRYLSDDGYLCVGHSENLSGISNDYQLIGKTIYKKAVENVQ